MSQGEDTAGFCQNCGAQLPEEAHFCPQCGALVTLKPDDKTRLFDRDRLVRKRQTAKLPKIYHVYSIVNNFRYKKIFYDKLKINWFIADRKEPPVPFEQAILNYSSLSTAARARPENHIKECFTSEEAEALKKYLADVQKTSAVIEEKELPINNTEKGRRDLPPGPGTDFIALYKKQNYDLPFKVEGIFNVKMADERIVPDERITVISKIPDILKE